VAAGLPSAQQLLADLAPLQSQLAYDVQQLEGPGFVVGIDDLHASRAAVIGQLLAEQFADGAGPPPLLLSTLTQGSP
jgi:hypothetical protein